jgi:hypothetical protein
MKIRPTKSGELAKLISLIMRGMRIWIAIALIAGHHDAGPCPAGSALYAWHPGAPSCPDGHYIRR